MHQAESQDALIPESEPTQPTDEETFLKLTQRAPVLRQRKPRPGSRPSDSSSAAGAEASATAEDAKPKTERWAVAENEPLTAGGKPHRGRGDAVAAAERCSFMLLTR